MSEKKEHNLNELLNTEEITETSDAATLAAKAKSAPAPAAPAPAPVAEEVSEAAGQIATGTFVNLFDYLTTHRAKIANAAITNLAGFSRVPSGKYMMFCTNDEENAELVLFERPNTLWMEQSIEPDSIKIENSGIIIKSNNCRFYVGKNNVSKVQIADGKVTGISVYSRSKSSDAVRVAQETVTQTQADVDTVKLHVKRVSPRLYNVVKDMTTKEEIKAGIQEFMNKIYDLNHLIKIEKELLLALSL